MRSGRFQKRGRQNEQCLGRSRGGFSSKIHLLIDALGFPLQFILTGGERHDLSQAESLLAPFHFDAVIADKGYSSDRLRELLTARQVEVVIPSRRYRRQPRDYDRIRYKKRNIVERFINRIKWYRRIFTRYKKLARSFMAFLHFASTLIWLERNVNEPYSKSFVPRSGEVLGLTITSRHLSRLLSPALESIRESLSNTISGVESSDNDRKKGETAAVLEEALPIERSLTSANRRKSASD